MSTAGVAGSILGLMAWKSEVQDTILRRQKDLRALTQENNIWTKAQSNYYHNSLEAVGADRAGTYGDTVNGDGFTVTAATIHQDAWEDAQENIDTIELLSQEIEAEVAQQQSDLATIQAEIEAEHAENKDNNKMYYGNPFQG